VNVRIIGVTLYNCQYAGTVSLRQLPLSPCLHYYHYQMGLHASGTRIAYHNLRYAFSTLDQYLPYSLLLAQHYHSTTLTLLYPHSTVHLTPTAAVPFRIGPPWSQEHQTDSVIAL
jgi:hypothetical protein